MNEGFLDLYRWTLNFRVKIMFLPREGRLWEPKNSLKIVKKMSKNVKNLNISSNNDPIELGKVLLDPY